MPLSAGGTLPVSAINVGLTAALPALNAEIAKLQADISRLGLAVQAQVELGIAAPNPVAIAAQISASFNPAEFLSQFNPANFLVAGADANAELLVELGFIAAQLEVVGAIAGQLQLGLSAGGLVGWSYAGRASGFGKQLARETAGGFSGVAPTEPISGLVIATADFSAWGSFSASFNTGPTAGEALGETTTVERLSGLGALTGGQWATGVADAFIPIDLFRLQLEAGKAAIEAQIEVSLGLNFPDVDALLEVELDIDVVLENLVTANVDIAAEISGINLRIQAVLDLMASIGAALSGGGLSFWSYTGPAGDFGPDLETALAGGLPGIEEPNGSIYGLAIACNSPSAWGSFGRIFKAA